MLKLTARQEQILNLIREAIDNTGFPPTRAEIAKELGFKSANAAEEHLQALARKGAIEIVSGTSRGIRLIGTSIHAAVPVPHIPAALLMSLPLVGRVAAGSPILAQVLRFYAQRDTSPQKWYPKNADGSVHKFDDLPAGLEANVNVEPPFDRPRGGKPALSEAEIRDVVAFLGTLSDGYHVSKAPRQGQSGTGAGTLSGL